MAKFNFTLNGSRTEVDVDPSTPLLWVLRDHLGLTGTKFGCGVAQCGACTVHVNDEGARVTTIEGLSKGGPHPLQKAWTEQQVPQCGYCQPGFIMAAAALIRQRPKPSEADIEASITNICRCGTYARIKRAILAAAG